MATTASISRSAPKGSAATWNAVLVGNGASKYSAQTVLTSWKSTMSAKKTVVFTTSARLPPAASMTALRFLIAWWHGL